jgi:hypothetical protein
LSAREKKILSLAAVQSCFPHFLVEGKTMDPNEEPSMKHPVEGVNLPVKSRANPPALAGKLARQPENKARRGSYLQAMLLAALLTMGPFRALADPAVPPAAFVGEELVAQETQAANPPTQAAGEEKILSEEEFKEFLRSAKVVQFKQTSKGVTAPTKLTLSDGQRTLDALFQSIDEFKSRMDFPTRTELNFRDSFHFNIAAYELARLLGLEAMIPPTVPYHWHGHLGSLCLWVPAKLDEMERTKRNIQPPDVNAWNKQLNKMWVFSELICDTDRNQTNILITDDWKLWVIDFTRAFRNQKNLFEPRHLVQCDRQLLEKLRHLDEKQVLEVTKHELSKGQVQGLMARRDKIVARFEELISQKGEDHVLY